MKKLYQIIFGLILAFGLVEPVFALQELVYIQEDDFSGEIVTDVGSGNGTLIGTFTPSQTTILNTSSVVGITWKNATAFCHASNHFSVFIASTTNPFESGGIWGTNSIFHAGTDYVFDEITSSETETIIGGHTYGIYATPNCGGGVNMTIQSDVTETDFYGYISTEGEYLGFNEELRYTRFISVDPEDEEVVATSTPIELSGYLYVNPDDMEEPLLLTDGWWIEIRYRRDALNQTAVANISLLDTVLRIDDDFVATYNSFSTTTTFLEDGRYTVRWSLHRPSVFASITSFFGLDAYFNAGVLATYQSHIVAGALTPYDEYVASFTEGVEGSFASSTLATLTQRLDTCNPLSNFSMLDCLAGLFTLDPVSSATVIEQFRSLIATKAPLGYVTRLVSIITGETATSSMPVISFEFPSTLPLGGEVLTFDFNEILSESKEIASSTLVTEDGDNVWTILMPIINSILYLLLFITIINDITGMYKHKDETR